MTRSVVFTLVLSLLGGCVAGQHRPLDADTFILLIDIPERHGSPMPASSSRAYHAPGGEWNLPVSLRDEVRSIVAGYDLDLVDVWPLPMIGELCVVVRSARATIESLSRDARISAIQAVNYFDVMGRVAYNDPDFALQFGAEGSELERLHAWSTGRGVTVGLVDTPVATDHEDLRGQIASQQIFVRDNLDEADELHGTAVAGIIAASANNGVGIVGLAPDVILRSYAACYHRDLWKRTVCDTFALAKALAAAHDDGVDILNLSLSGPYDALIEALIRKLVEDGTIVIAADDPAAARGGFPASLGVVIAATSPAETREFEPPAVRAADEHLSTKPGNGYQFFYGTSMSAARVTALTSLLISRERMGYSAARIALTTLRERCGSNDPAGAECVMSFALWPGRPAINAGL